MNMREAFAQLDTGQRIERKGWAGAWLEGRAKAPTLMTLSNRHGQMFIPTVEEVLANDWQVCLHSPGAL